jgi:hypothetical protein
MISLELLASRSFDFISDPKAAEVKTEFFDRFTLQSTIFENLCRGARKTKSKRQRCEDAGKALLYFFHPLLRLAFC